MGRLAGRPEVGRVGVTHRWVFELREALAVHGVNLAEFTAHAEGHDTPQGGGGEQDGDEVAGSEAAPVGARAVPILRRQLVV